MRALARYWFRKLPPHVQEGLRTIRAGARNAAPTRPAVDAASLQLPHALTPARFAELVDKYDALPDEQARREMTLSVFDHVSLNPETFRLLHNPYGENKFKDHALFQQAFAAWQVGTGENQAAFARLATLAARMPSAFAALLAARCLMRPPGFEKEMLPYLQDAVARYPDDLHLVANFAAALFVQGEVKEANANIARVEKQFRDAAEPQRANLQKSSRTLNHAIDHGIADHTAFEDTAYFEESVEEMWETYFRLMIGQPEHLMFGWLNRRFQRAFAELAVPPIEKVINFGVMCAQPDVEAAGKHPRVRFFGVDTQRETQRINRLAYSAPNVEFIAATIEDALPRIMQSGGPAALFHARTATLLFPQRLRQIYRLCASSGVRRIALFENHSISHDHYRFFRFDDMPRESVIYKNWQFLHNYKKLLEEAGYRITRQEVVLSPLITPQSTMDLASTHVYLLAELA